jgi:hypothetical protein
MKKVICLIVAAFAISVCAQTKPPEYDWQATLKVVDETGQPVEAAKVRVFYMLTNEIAGLTDSNGIFVASHRDSSENLGFQAEKPHYYPFSVSYHMGRNYKPEKWNPVQTVILKRIIHPIPMYAKSVNLGMPVFDKPAGFDFMIGDWIAPYGKGLNSDIVFTAHREKRLENDSDYQLTISFPKVGDGIQEFSGPLYYLGSRGSALRSAEEAPVDGYQSEWIQTKTRRPGKPMESNWSENRNYYFRVRTATDDRGNVVSTHYGKIYGDFMKFTYYLNPTPNSRNVEFDPKQNLLKSMKFNEGVDIP